MKQLSVTSPQSGLHLPVAGGQPALLTHIAWLLLFAWSGAAFAQESDRALEEVTVTATLLKAGTPPVSATVLTEQIQSRRGAAHLEDVITLAPNVAASSGASRSRFFQIRGIGERSQFVEPVNPSVGILLDGIDLSGAGGALTLFDVRQVEVLRGPQGTLMGANALAGLIAVQSNGTDSGARDLSVGIENKGGYRLGARWGGHLTNKMNGRLAVQQYELPRWSVSDRSTWRRSAGAGAGGSAWPAAGRKRTARSSPLARRPCAKPACRPTPSSSLTGAVATPKGHWPMRWQETSWWPTIIPTGRAKRRNRC